MVSPEDSGPSGSPKSRRKDVVDALPPHSIEAEQGVLGCIALKPGDCLRTCDQERITSGHFFDLRHAEIFEVMQDCREKFGYDFDGIALRDELKDQGKLDNVGGIAYVSTLADVVPSAENLPYYITILKEKFSRRRIIKLCSECASKAWDGGIGFDDMMDFVSHDFHQLIKSNSLQRLPKLSDLDSLNQIDMSDTRYLLLGDDYIERGGACVIAASSGIGKSVLEVQLAVLWALGRPAFGVTPNGPLKSVIIYAENSERENRKTILSICSKLEIAEGSDDWDSVAKNVKFRECYQESAEEFVGAVRRIAEADTPDIVWVDPLAAYAGDDISKTTTIHAFLRKGLDPVAKEFGFGLMVINHFTKPSGEKKKETTKSDRQHAAAGRFIGVRLRTSNARRSRSMALKRARRSPCMTPSTSCANNSTTVPRH